MHRSMGDIKRLRLFPVLTRYFRFDLHIRTDNSLAHFYAARFHVGCHKSLTLDGAWLSRFCLFWKPTYRKFRYLLSVPVKRSLMSAHRPPKHHLLLRNTIFPLHRPPHARNYVRPHTPDF